MLCNSVVIVNELGMSKYANTACGLREAVRSGNKKDTIGTPQLQFSFTHVQAYVKYLRMKTKTASMGLRTETRSQSAHSQAFAMSTSRAQAPVRKPLGERNVNDVQKTGHGPNPRPDKLVEKKQPISSNKRSHYQVREFPQQTR